MVGSAGSRAQHRVGEPRGHRDLHDRHDLAGLDSEGGGAKDAIGFFLDERLVEASAFPRAFGRSTASRGILARR